MLEWPEAATLAGQMNRVLADKRIRKVTTGHSPHKWAWFHGDPGEYGGRLEGRRIQDAASYGGMVEIRAEGAYLLFGEGVSLRYHEDGARRPDKHQLLVELEDGSALSASVQMYGGLWCFEEGTFDNPYYRLAQEKPSPLSDAFDAAYWERLVEEPAVQKLSAKALLATEQRIPGLGNGVLQDILHHAGIHPKKKVLAFSSAEKYTLYIAVRTILGRMADQGGRDTETDLFGSPGGYATVMSKRTVGGSCPRCGGTIRKEAYLGGAVYYCGDCQTI
ncbi:hypothetical protein [Gorillibacterium sp. sgz5001074]|uniref:hypothetical protein n=1 Tax=Gorillibacterium sp. sgz5001074 TaxID=3446695 RepID=UPI003F6660ED